MHMFYLNRLIDKSGVSGTGVVAEGVVFTNGKCVLTWLSEHLLNTFRVQCAKSPSA